MEPLTSLLKLIDPFRFTISEASLIVMNISFEEGGG